MEVGYIGLGIMGGALAGRLLQSRSLHVFDLSQDRVGEYRQRGAIAIESPAEMAEKCDTVVLCLPRSKNVETAIFGAGGLLQGGGSRLKTIIDQTSGDPRITRQMAADLAERGIMLFDAPVSGGRKGAEAGTIAIMGGGPAEPFEQLVKPLLSEISPNTFYCGEVGAGQVLKLLNNTISTCNRLATLEAIAVGLKNGLSLSVMTDVLNSGGARSRATENLLPALLRGEFTASFALSLMLKDLNLATEVAVESDAPLQFGQMARGFLQATSNAFGADADLNRIIDLVQLQAGTQIYPHR